MNATAIQTKLMELQSNMFNFAYMLTSNRDDAYDLMQDTTLKVLDNQDKYSENSNFKGWVFTIMRNLFINNYRRASKMTALVDVTENLYSLQLADDAEISVPEGSIACQEITDAINSFTPDFREPFALHVAGYKYEEISEKLNLPLGTVKSRIFTARKRLQKQFADYVA